jgi:hypothetical protein
LGFYDVLAYVGVVESRVWDAKGVALWLAPVAEAEVDASGACGYVDAVWAAGELHHELEACVCGEGDAFGLVAWEAAIYESAWVVAEVTRGRVAMFAGSRDRHTPRRGLGRAGARGRAE